MRFTDTFLRQVRDRVSIADYAGKRLSWDKRKSQPGRGDFWACCPFHNEKTASFHVLDAKGIYNCFGCGEKGDAFTLAMKLEGVSFPEAVARMAELAGMPLPVDEREDRGENDRRKRLQLAMTKTAALYAEALTKREGKAAREYLAGRGFDAELCKRFGIGFAPGGKEGGWTWTIDKLKADGFTLDELAAAGIAKEGEDDKRAFDFMRERITFEIADPAGRVIAFAGRALDPDNKAKYINSPETPLFSKGRTLYRLKTARELAAKSKAAGLVVAEGQLDVIAFERAGIGAVAPMGTALTDDQLQMIWRSGGEPILCFDGDTAGRRAADRALDLALPHLGPGRTIRIALMPQGEDPDDVFRRSGPEALQLLLAAALPASEALFEREKARRALETPEARAALKANLREAANKIADADTKRQYLSTLLARADALFRTPYTPPAPFQRGDGKRYGRFQPPPQPATQELKVKSAQGVGLTDRERFLSAAIDNPALLDRFADLLDRLPLERDLAAIRAGIHALSHGDSPVESIDRAALSLHLTQSGEQRAAARLERWPKARPNTGASTGPAGAGDVETEWLALMTREVVLPAIKEELDALRPLADEGDDAAFARFQALSREAHEIEARARAVKLEEGKETGATPDDLVA